MNADWLSARRTLAIAAALVTGVALISGSRIANGKSFPVATTLCRAVDDFSSGTRFWVIEVASSTDSVMAATRAEWGIATLDSTAIVFVQDSITCARGARAHAIAAGQDTLSPPSVYLLRIGPTRYMAWNGVVAHGSLIQFLFDSSFALLDALGS